MPRGRPPCEPSGRNLQIYHELVCEGRLQAEVAARFRVSQPRIAQLRREINHWIDHLLPASTTSRLPLASGLTREGQRLHLAIALRHQQLTAAYREYLGHFGGPTGAPAYAHLFAAQKAGLVPNEVAARLPPRSLILAALRMARELDDLAAIARRGPFFTVSESSPLAPRGTAAPNSSADQHHVPDAQPTTASQT